MRILLSAFSFAPHQGSEPGVGWRWAQELAREHDVVVVTDTTRQALVEPELALHPQPRLQVVYFRPPWLRRVPLNSSTAQVLYLLWQFALLGCARRLHAQQPFDLALHLTYGVFRHPSFLGALGVPFVFGPVGGGEDVPLRLKRSIHGSEKVKELLRSLANQVARVDPLLWWAYARADLILVKTAQTRDKLPWPVRQRAVVFPEIGVDAPPPLPATVRAAGAPLRLLFAGRLVGWKGAHLALMALALARARGVDATLDLVGRGPFEPQLRALSDKLALGAAVRFHAHMPQAELFNLYRQAHGFLFPSLHDSSGNVVLEAQAFGCPVICLDCGGPATLVNAQTAIVIATAGAGEAEVATRLADAVQCWADDEPRRQAMARAAQAHARDCTWERRVHDCLRLAETSLGPARARTIDFKRTPRG